MPCCRHSTFHSADRLNDSEAGLDTNVLHFLAKIICVRGRVVPWLAQVMILRWENHCHLLAGYRD